MFAATTQGFNVDAGSFLAIVATAAIAGTLSAGGRRPRLFIPVVVVELALGVLIGPQAARTSRTSTRSRSSSPISGSGCCSSSPATRSTCERIRGRAAAACTGRAGSLSLAIAYSLGGILAAVGVVVSLVYVGLGAGDHRDRHADPGPLGHGRAGTVSAATCWRPGAVGEFGPILLLTLVLSTQSARAQRADPRRVRRARGRRRRARGALGRARPSRCSSGRSRPARSSRCAGSSCSCSRSRCSPPTSGSTCCSAGSPPA